MWALWGYVIGSVMTIVVLCLIGVAYSEWQYVKTLRVWHNEWKDNEEFYIWCDAKQTRMMNEQMKENEDN